MRTYLVCAVLVAAIAAVAHAAAVVPTTWAANEPAKPCNVDECVAPDCRCSSTQTPGGIALKDTPQMVLFTFDDAMTKANYDAYFKVFDGHTNPDGCPFQSTHFISHEYCDYTVVHEMQSKGHEIALHSISHLTDTKYWRELNATGYAAEFGGMRDIVAHFADVAPELVRGMRTPFLQLAGDASFEGAAEAGLEYDSSWPTIRVANSLWPYTLDYRSDQDCPIGPCPTASVPGLWVNPMVDWTDDNGTVCAMVDSCAAIPRDADGVFDFIMRNFQRTYEGSRTPFGFYVHAAWFYSNPENFVAYQRFVEHLDTLDDVYVVGIARALEWVRNPQPLDALAETWPACQPQPAYTCQPRACQLEKIVEGEPTVERWMQSCAKACPDVYPWLGNPLGKRP